MRWFFPEESKQFRDREALIVAAAMPGDIASPPDR